MYGVRSAVAVQHPSSTNHLILTKLVVIYLMRAVTSFLSVKCGTEVTAALCLSLFLLLLLSVSGESSLELLRSPLRQAGSSAHMCPRGPETAEHRAGWEVSVLSALVPSVASPPRSALPPPPSEALCVWTLLPRGLAALWPFHMRLCPITLLTPLWTQSLRPHLQPAPDPGRGERDEKQRIICS